MTSDAGSSQLGPGLAEAVTLAGRVASKTLPNVSGPDSDSGSVRRTLY